MNEGVPSIIRMIVLQMCIEYQINPGLPTSWIRKPTDSLKQTFLPSEIMSYENLKTRKYNMAFLKINKIESRLKKSKK